VSSSRNCAAVSRFSQPALGFASPDSIFVLVFVPVRPLSKAPRPFSILGEARRRPSGWDLESPASFVLSEHRTAGCRFVLRVLGFGAAGWLSIFFVLGLCLLRFALSSASLPQRAAVALPTSPASAPPHAVLSSLALGLCAAAGRVRSGFSPAR
jgi:hypothetical protein